MPVEVTWYEIAIRLFCTVVAGGAIGGNRSEHGHAAGLRTSILVSLAACIAMIQVNLMLPLAGRSPTSFVMNDLMRLPLGILSGMGFIGAGAIVRRDSMIVGVTTAATLWFLTVVGLCFGGGLIGLGLASTALGLLVLAGFKAVEKRMKQDRGGRLVIVTGPSGPDENQIRGILHGSGFQIASSAFAATAATTDRELTCGVQWRARSGETQVPDFVRQLAAHEGVVRIAWTPEGS
jgi:putative Mg2+ transporter-C (MgtC) family protein